MTDKKILFMGTSDFAVACLEAMIKDGKTPAAVVSQPDRPKGRGYGMAMTPVKTKALEHGIEVVTPETLKDGAFLPELERFAPDMIVVAAYGKILPEYILNYPKYGCINVHGSLLPKYRGAAPINHAIMDGEKMTGVTIMYMEKGLDTGDMIKKARTKILDEDNFGTLHDRLAFMGGKLLCEVIDDIFAGRSERKAQKGPSSYAHMLDNSVRKIDFSETAVNIVNKIRGLSPVPTAYCTLNGKNVKIYSAAVADVERASEECGSIIRNKKRILINTGDGVVEVFELQPEGKRRMTATEFLAGTKPEKFE